jgi:hypothetical protein
MKPTDRQYTNAARSGRTQPGLLELRDPRDPQTPLAVANRADRRAHGKARPTKTPPPNILAALKARADIWRIHRGDWVTIRSNGSRPQLEGQVDWVAPTTGVVSLTNGDGYSADLVTSVRRRNTRLAIPGVGA